MALNFLGDISGNFYNLLHTVIVGTYVRANWNDETEEYEHYFYSSKSSYESGSAGTYYDSSLINPEDLVALGSEYSSYQYCSGNNLVKFKLNSNLNYPFYYQEIHENNFACSQIVCDLAFKPNPTITPTYVEVEATSSYLPVEYSLNANFIYGVNGNPFGTFDLSAGVWTIYAKDGVGCQASITVTVPSAQGYSKRFTSTSKDIKGGDTVIEIYKKKYLGSSEEVRGTGEPLFISWGQKGQLKTEPIKGSKADVFFISETESKFLELFTSDSTEFRVDVVKNGSLFWRGWLLPEFYQEPYTQAKYPVQLSATDGLGDLKNFPFVLNNRFEYYTLPQNLSGRLSHLEVIVICLNKIGLELPIYTAVNLFEENMPYLPGQGILVATYSPTVGTTYQTNLVAGTLYNFKIEGTSLNVQVYYNGEYINEVVEVDYKLTNSEFENSLDGWESVLYRSGSSWFWEDGKAKAIQRSFFTATNTHILRQAYNFREGINYTLEISVKRVNHTATSRSKIFVYIGTLQYSLQIHDGDYAYFNETYSLNFTPINNNHQYLNMYFTWENDDVEKDIELDYVRLFDESATALAEWSFTPAESNGELVISDATTLEIYESVKDPMSSIYVDAANYYPNDEPMNCYDVLQEQLKPYGARIFQAEGAWHIVKFDQLNGEYQRNRYTSQGVYQYSELYQPIINLTNPTVADERIWVNETMNLEITPGYKFQRIQQSLGYIENLIKGGDFNQDDFYTSGTTIGGLKHFSYGSLNITPSGIVNTNPLWYSKVQLDANGNYGIDFNYRFGGIKLIEVVTYIIIVGNEGDDFEGDYEPFGLPTTGQLKDGDLVLVQYNYDSSKSNVYKVKEKSLWEPLFGSYITTYVKIMQGSDRGNYYKLRRHFEEETTIDQIYTPAPESMGQGFTSYSWIKSNPLSLEFANTDKITIKIGYLFNKAASGLFTGTDYHLGIEVKLGNFYLGHWGEFTLEPQWIQIPIENTDKTSEIVLTFKTKTFGLGLVSPSNFTIKIWAYTTYPPSQTNSEEEGDWGGVNLNLGTDQTIYSNLIIDYIKAIYLPGGFAPETTEEHRLNNSIRYSLEPEDIEVMHGDAPDVLNTTKIYNQYLTLEDGTLTQNWKRKNYYESKNLLKLLLESILANNLKSNQLISGDILYKLTLLNTIYDPENPDKVFMINAADYNDYSQQTSVELSEITLNENLSNSADAAFTVGFSVGFKS